MSIHLNAFMRCLCGKTHVVSQIWHSTTCPACGRSLWDQVYKHYRTPTKETTDG